MKMIVDLALFLSDLLFILSFIYIAINHITSLKQTHLLFVDFLEFRIKKAKKFQRAKFLSQGVA